MAILQLHNLMTSDVLILPGIFIDTYLPIAKGDDLKVFLYLFRAVSRPENKVSLASISDALEFSEKEVLRSLTYWEKAGILRLSFNSDHILEAISILDIESPALSMQSKKQQVQSQPQKQISEPELPAVQKKELTGSSPKEPASSAPRDLTAKELNALNNDLDFTGFVFMAEQSFGIPFSPNDITRFGYWYVNFNRSTAILETLLEYCTNQCQTNRPSIRYFDTVAAGWFSEGIRTPEQAKEYSQTRSALAFSIMKTFGLKARRDPLPSEQALIRKWTKDYGFSSEMILLACTRTASQTNHHQFSYADSILTSWYENHISTPSQVEQENLNYKKRSASDAASAKRPIEISKSARQFHNFEERTTNYEELVLNQFRQSNNS